MPSLFTPMVHVSPSTARSFVTLLNSFEGIFTFTLYSEGRGGEKGGDWVVART